MKRNDEYYMRRALELAVKARGMTSPNPLVGAIVVKNGRIIGEGFHKRAGSAHAEAIALKKAGRRADAATLYVNLEPCAHYGKTPPCTGLIMKKGIKKVVIAMPDPNPLNKGRGTAALRARGIRVKRGILEKEARAINKEFTTLMTQGRPFVTLKMAESIDGKIATHRGDSRWISSSASRRFVHRLRSEADAVMVGANTVLKDDPLLTARSNGRAGARQPLRVVVDAALRVPLGAKVFLRKAAGRALVATTKDAPQGKIGALKRKGVDVLVLKGTAHRVDLKELLKALKERGIMSLLVEGGGRLSASLFEGGLVDKVLFFIAPKIVGGRDAVSAVEGKGVAKIRDAVRLESVSVERFGEDILLEGYVRR